jgi:integrase-like protein
MLWLMSSLPSSVSVQSPNVSTPRAHQCKNTGTLMSCMCWSNGRLTSPHKIAFAYVSIGEDSNGGVAMSTSSKREMGVYASPVGSVLSYREEQLYLSEASQPLRDIATLMLETGMRPEEVYFTTAANVDLEDNFLFNPVGKTKAAKRKIALTGRAAEVLKMRLAAAAGKYLSTPEKPQQANIEGEQCSPGRALKRCGITPFRLYDLRHTWATRAAMSGIDLVTLAAMLGHSRIQMVLRYAHPTAQHQAAAMRRLEEFNGARQVAEYDRTDGQSLHIPLQ